LTSGGARADGAVPPDPAQAAAPALEPVPLTTILREWGRIGCIGFGGPPTHIKMLRDLCVERRHWLTPEEFEDAIVVCNLLPGPASTQLAIFCAWRLRRRPGALVGGTAFIVPGLIVILALAALFLSKSPPLWVLGAGAGAGAAVPAVAIHAATSLTGPSWKRRRQTLRWLIYLIVAAAAAATLGVWLVLVILGCGVFELAMQLFAGRRDGAPLPGVMLAPIVAAGAIGGGVLLSVAWVALKVGALSFGGGFVIIPLMQADAVNHYHWMTGAQFLNAVALGQITPGPVVQTVAVVDYAAAGLVGGILASPASCDRGRTGRLGAFRGRGGPGGSRRGGGARHRSRSRALPLRVQRPGVLGVRQRHVQEHPHVRVVQPVIHHPALPPRRGHDPMRAQPPHRVTGRRLAHPGRSGQVTHAHLTAFQQRDQQPQPVRITQQREHIRGLLHILGRGHRLLHSGDPLPVHHPDQASVQAGDIGRIVHTYNRTAIRIWCDGQHGSPVRCAVLLTWVTAAIMAGRIRPQACGDRPGHGAGRCRGPGDRRGQVRPTAGGSRAAEHARR
jgi:chromate transporter